MRFIDRSQIEPPELLHSVRAESGRADVQAFIEATQSKGGTRRAPSAEWLVRDETFRSDVRAAFGGTCAYCERFTETGSKENRGQVSHHRPEALAQDEYGNTDLTAYAWLMYEWDNIVWVCSDCHRRKGNKFFIERKRGEPGMPVESLREFESELLLDPTFHDPTEHLAFQMDGTVNWNSEKGHATVAVLELDDAEHVMRRRERIFDVVSAMADNVIDFEAYFASPGGEPGRGAYVLNRSGDTFQHAGAVTQALLGFAKLRGMKVGDGWQLLDALRGLDPDGRQAFLDYALDATAPRSEKTSGAIEITPSPPKPARKRRVRIPDVRKLPTALSPITCVEISNFKALHDIHFDLPASVEDTRQSPCMLLLGENATGKSSVLEAMALAIIGTDEAEALEHMLPDEDLRPSDLIHRPDPSKWNEPAPGMAIRLTFLDHRAPVGFSAKPGDTRFSGTETCAKVILGYGPRRYFTNRKTRRLRAPAHRVRSLFDPMNMIANPIHWLSDLDRDQFYAAARALRVILMLDNDDDFERDDDPDTPGAIYVTHNGQRTAMKDLSVGYKSVIAMACDIIRELLYHYDNIEFAHAVVFIDEIETHLHPRWKMRIMQLMREAFPKVQFIVTTHDPLCLRGMYDGEVFVLQRSGAEAQVEKVEDLPSIRGMRAEQILTSEFFGLGSTDPKTDAKLARYNILAARHEALDAAEREELDRLRDELDDNMVIGTTLYEQALAEALKEENAKRDVQPTDTPTPRRKAIKSRFAALFDEPGAP